MPVSKAIGYYFSDILYEYRDGDGSMKLIDEEGALFGIINIIDALVILLVIAVGIAGAALVFADDSESSGPTQVTAHATVDLGTHPPNIARAIDEGDQYSVDDTSTVTITDLHLSPQNDTVRVIARLKIEAEVDEDVLQYDGAPLRLGRSLEVQTPRYQVSGRIQSVGGNDTLAIDSQTVIVQTKIPAGQTDAVAAGDTINAGGQTVATIEQRRIYPIANSTQHSLSLQVEMKTHRRQGQPYFGSTPLRAGQNLTLPASEITLDGQIERIGSNVEVDSTSERTVTLRMTDTPAPVVELLQPGLTEQFRNRTIARLKSVEAEPSPTIARTDTDSLKLIDHPTNQDVTLQAEIMVRETPAGAKFKNALLRQSSTVQLNFGTTTVEATVIRVQG